MKKHVIMWVFTSLTSFVTVCQSPAIQSKFDGMYTVVHRPEGKVMLVKPLTYMNLSGECVRPLMDYFDVDVEDIVVHV